MHNPDQNFFGSPCLSNYYIDKNNPQIYPFELAGNTNIVKSIEEVIDSFSAEAFLAQLAADQDLTNKYQLPPDYYLINKLFYYPTALYTGTNTLVAAFKLTDGTQSFVANPTTMLSPQIGSIIFNTTTGEQCFVTAVDNAITLSISANIMNLNDTYTIYNSRNITEVERVNQNNSLVAADTY